MASHRSGFEKREREKAKRAKQAAKREKRAEEKAAEEAADASGAPDQAGLLEQLAQLHKRFDDGDIEFEDFEEQRTELLDQINI